MTKLLQILVCLVGYPLVVPFIWVDLTRRDDLDTGSKISWALVVLLWPFPAVYVAAGGRLW